MKVRLSPWPAGQDTVSDEYHRKFTPTPERTAPLKAAVNVDLDDEGNATLRAGITARKTGTAFKTAFPFGTICLLQDGGTLSKADTSFDLTTLEPGLNASLDIVYHEWAGQVFWSNTEVVGRVDSAGASKNWGLTVPPVPSLAATAGSLLAGTYRVACTVVDASSIESGALKANEITLGSTQGITVTLSSVDANATHVNVYMSRKDEPRLYWHSQVAVGAMPTTVTALGSSKRPLRTQHLGPPPAGNGIFSYRGYLFVIDGGTIFRSKGQAGSLFALDKELMLYSPTVKAGVGLENGFFVATSKGLNWVSGRDPEGWEKLPKDNRRYLEGGIKLSSKLLPGLRTAGEVALFVSEDGLVVGYPDGSVDYPTHPRLPIGTSLTKAALLYRSSGDLRQILMSLS